VFQNDYYMDDIKILRHFFLQKKMALFLHGDFLRSVSRERNLQIPKRFIKV